MKIELKGNFKLKAPREKSYRFLVDPQRFGKALPDLQSLEVLSPTSFKAVFQVGISFIKGPISAVFEISESEEGKRARYRGKGTGLGSFVEVDASFELDEASEGTHVTWEGVAQVGGRLAPAAGGLLKPVAEKNAKAFIESLTQEIERQA